MFVSNNLNFFLADMTKKMFWSLELSGLGRYALNNLS